VLEEITGTTPGSGRRENDQKKTMDILRKLRAKAKKDTGAADSTKRSYSSPAGKDTGKDAQPEKQYELKDCLTVVEDVDGKNNYRVNQKVIDYFLDRTARHAKEYPPKFRTAEERRDAEKELRGLIDVMDVLVKNHPSDPEVLLRAGSAYSMGHNLDFESSAQKAADTFEKLLKIAPEHPEGNYAYGMFLAGTAAGRPESVAYLQKAAKLGINDALYTLGLVALSGGEKDKGLEYLEAYAKLHPRNKRVKKVIGAAKNGKIKFHEN
jgi:tetratricopeptide (TPR) repeat protein